MVTRYFCVVFLWMCNCAGLSGFRFSTVYNSFICCWYKKNELISCLRYWVLLMSSVKPFYFQFNGKYCLNCRLREILEYFSFFFKQVETKPEKHFAFTKELKRGGRLESLCEFLLPRVLYRLWAHSGIIGGFAQAKARTYVYS